jgi:hypothetical protein
MIALFALQYDSKTAHAIEEAGGPVGPSWTSWLKTQIAAGKRVQNSIAIWKNACGYLSTGGQLKGFPALAARVNEMSRYPNTPLEQKHAWMRDRMEAKAAAAETARRLDLLTTQEVATELRISYSKRGSW